MEHMKVCETVSCRGMEGCAASQNTAEKRHLTVILNGFRATLADIFTSPTSAFPYPVTLRMIRRSPRRLQPQHALHLA